MLYQGYTDLKLNSKSSFCLHINMKASKPTSTQGRQKKLSALADVDIVAVDFSQRHSN